MLTPSFTRISCLAALAFAVVAPFSGHALAQAVTFKKITLEQKFYSEGASYGDIDKDGQNDLVSGPYWYPGPGYGGQRYTYYTPKEFDPRTTWSDHFFSWIEDFNGDGWKDILVIAFPGDAANWFENPGAGVKANVAWKKHLIYPNINGENPIFGDIDGDGKSELIFNVQGQAGLCKPVPGNPNATWIFTPITEKQKWWDQWTHNMGFGDIDADGRSDLISQYGWYSQPPKGSGNVLWAFHPYTFSTEEWAGPRMHVYDFDGDGDADIASGLASHGWGLAWFEQVQEGGNITFKKHLIMETRAEESKYTVTFSQVHSLGMADIDGDGLPDLVTGKRHWGHGDEGDPEPNGPSILAWFKLTRSNGTAQFVGQKIDEASGSGTQMTVGDYSGDGWPDILIGNKNGTFAFVRSEVAPKPTTITPPHLKIRYRNLESTVSNRLIYPWGETRLRNFYDSKGRVQRRMPLPAVNAGN